MAVSIRETPFDQKKWKERKYVRNSCHEFALLNLDISECQVESLASEHSNYSHNCHNDANCTNTKGSFYCTCHHGYSGNGVICVGNWHHFIVKHYCC